jgi:hypothetical protein
LSAEFVDEPEFVGLTQSILSGIPSKAFHRDGSLRTLLEQRIMAGRLRLERRANVSISASEGGTEPTVIRSSSRNSTRKHAEE